jgi:CRP-like cAMP-binding protein
MRRRAAPTASGGGAAAAQHSTSRWRAFSTTPAAATVGSGEGSGGVLALARRNAGTIYNFGMLSSCACFIATDILHLRLLSVLGTSCAIFFNWNRAPPWNAVYWGVAFVSINAAQIVLLIQERRRKPPSFTEEELEVFTQHFSRHALTVQGYVQILSLGEWREFSAGQALMTEGHATSQLILVHRGDVSCTVKDAVVDRVEGGTAHAWVGEMGYLNEEGLTGPQREALNDLPRTTCVAASASVRALVFEKDRLRSLLRERPEIGLALNAALGSCVVGKLRRKLVEDESGRAAHYREVLTAVVCDGIVHPAEKRMLREYREGHGISQVAHKKELEELGWSEVEWYDGCKGGAHKLPTHHPVAQRLAALRGGGGAGAAGPAPSS